MVHGVNEKEFKWNWAEKSKTFQIRMQNSKTSKNKVEVLIQF